MANKVDAATLKRLLQLKYEFGLTDKVIGIRLGISERTIRVYTRAHREGQDNITPSSNITPTSTLLGGEPK